MAELTAVPLAPFIFSSWARWSTASAPNSPDTNRPHTSIFFSFPLFIIFPLT